MGIVPLLVFFSQTPRWLYPTRRCQNVLEFLSLAGARQLAANAYLLRGPWGEVLIEAGASLPKDVTWLEKLERAPDVVLLTHAHADHIGALPDLLERYPGQQTFASKGTRDLSRVALDGLLRARGVDKQIASQRADAIASCVRSIPMMRPVSLPIADQQQASATLTLYPCGHILGAASMQLDMEFGSKFHTIYFLLDFCAHAQPLTPRASFPVSSPERPIDTLVMESVLATERQANDVDYDAELERLLSWVERRDGPCLLALASLGEAPEIAGALLAADHDVLIHEHLEPIVRLWFEEAGRQLSPGLFASQGACASALAAGAVVIAPGEHLDQGTPARALVEPLIGLDTARIGIMNSLRHRSFAGRLLATKQGRAIKKDRGKRTRHAEIERFILPNHAPRWALLGAVRALAPKRVLLVHGQKKAQGALERALRDDGYEGEILIPEIDVPISLLDGLGLGVDLG